MWLGVRLGLGLGGFALGDCIGRLHHPTNSLVSLSTYAIVTVSADCRPDKQRTNMKQITLLIRAAWCGRRSYGIQDWLSPVERDAMVTDYRTITRGTHPTARTPYNWADAK